MARSKGIPSYGRPMKRVMADIQQDLPAEHSSGPVKIGSPETFAADVPLNNTGPTIVRGVIEGEMPNWPRMARGRLISQEGKYGKGSGPPIP